MCHDQFAILVAAGLAAASTPADGQSAIRGDAVTPVQTAGWTRVHRIEAPGPRSAPAPAGADPCDELALSFAATAVDPEGDTPSELAFTPDGTRIVIAHRDSANLVVFDASTRTVLQTIAVSGSPNSLAIAADSIHVVTANLFEDTASIVDLAAGREVAVVAVGDQPGVVRITPDGSTAVVGNTLDGTLSVVDIATATEVRQISGAGFAQITSFGAWAITYRFTDFAITPDGATAVFPDLFANEIDFFDIATGAATTVPSQPEPAGIDLDASGAICVVSHDFPESLVTVLDVPGRAITDELATGGAATLVPPVAINDSGTKLVVGVQNAVRVIDLATGTPSGDLATGSVNALGRTADGRHCVVGNYLGSLVSFQTETIVANLLSTTTPDALAVSPAGPRAATAHALRKEVMEVMNVNGASGFFEGVVPTGPPPEGDKARGVALTADGSRALVINNHSQNVTIIETKTHVVSDVYAVGERPGGVAVTADDTTAVVANLDSSFASVIDLGAGTVTNVGISRRGSTVAVSPDGQYAYVPVVADGDGVWRIDIPSRTVAGGKIPTGNMGGIGFVFDMASGMTLSHDGATLVTCGSFDDDVSIIDTASWTEVARVPVGDFPVRAVFSPDDSRIYVSAKNDSTVAVVTNDGAASAVIDTLVTFAQPFEMAIDPTGATLYVACFADKAVAAFGLPSHDLDAVIPLPETNGAGQPVGLHVSADGSFLYVAANGADFHVIDTVTNTIIDTINTGLAPAQLVFDDATRCAYMPTPFGGDGLSIVRIVDACACPGDVDGSGDVGFDDLLAVLSAWGPCPGCPEDIDDSGDVGFDDLLSVLATWGPCP